MVIAIAILLTIVSLVIVAIPFIRYRHSRQLVNPMDMVDDLSRRRQLMYQELAMVKENYELGNIPEAEFQAVSQNLRRRAAESLWLQRRWEQQLKSLDDALEQQVSELRRTLKSQDGTASCSECGSTPSASDNSCHQCGASLTPREPVFYSRGKTG